MLLRKFLNYNNESRSKIAIPDVVMAMSRDVMDVVNNGYVALIGVFCNFCYLFYLLVFIIWVTTDFTDFQPLSFIPLFISCFMCGMTVMFLKCREEGQRERRKTEFEAENMMTSAVLKNVYVHHPSTATSDSVPPCLRALTPCAPVSPDSHSLLSVITTERRSPWPNSRHVRNLSHHTISDMCRSHEHMHAGPSVVQTYNKAVTAINNYVVHSNYLVDLLKTVVVGGFMAGGGIPVIRESLDFATYFTILSVFLTIGEFTPPPSGLRSALRPPLVRLGAEL